MEFKFNFNAETAPTMCGKNRGTNILFLLSTQITLNDRLKIERIISLNEILAYIGLSEIGKEGDAIVWRYTNGDIIDFHLLDDDFDPLKDDPEITIKLVV